MADILDGIKKAVKVGKDFIEPVKKVGDIVDTISNPTKLVEKGVEKSLKWFNVQNPEDVDWEKEGEKDSESHNGIVSCLNNSLQRIESYLLNHIGQVNGEEQARRTVAQQRITDLEKEKNELPNKIAKLTKEKDDLKINFDNRKINIEQKYNNELKQLDDELIQFTKEKEDECRQAKKENKELCDRQIAEAKKEHEDEKNKIETEYNLLIENNNKLIADKQKSISTMKNQSYISLEFIIEGVLLILITFFLFIFYSSVVNSALFKSFVLTDSSEIDKLIVSSIFDPEALSNATGMQLAYLCSAPAVFLTLGFVLHLCMNIKNKLKKWLSSVGVVLLAFTFDGLLAFSVSKKIFDMTSQLRFGAQETYSWITDTNFWVTIFFGFVVYIFWGILFSAFINACNSEYKDTKKSIAELQKDNEKHESIKQQKLKDEIDAYNIDNIKKKYDKSSDIERDKNDKIGNKKTEINTYRQTKKDEKKAEITEETNNFNSENEKLKKDIDNYNVRLNIGIPQEICDNQKIIAETEENKTLSEGTIQYFNNYCSGWTSQINRTETNKMQRIALVSACDTMKEAFINDLRNKYNWKEEK